ncbi:hypothetical protein JKY72_05380 [Candidatus Gracilibacteria bacterium]|nr:hypothetical protein [Candidatus Gracilibacteria bacterium]
MNTTLDNIKKVSLVFFIVTGLIHFSANILLSNTLFLEEASVISKITDIPFLLTGLIYGLSSLRIAFTDTEKSHKKLDIFLFSTIIVALLILIIVNIFIPDL